jgi:glycosyltransferase involved in cell wall biosynthesis
MRKVAFLCNEPGISGGINVIFHHAMGLVREGMTVAIVCGVDVTPSHLAWHRIAGMAYHPNLLWLNFETVMHHEFDIAIATWWRTYFDLWKIKAKKYAYFVQSIESRFYPMSEMVVRNAVDATYDARIGFITEARWIKDYLSRMHGHNAGLAFNGLDKSIYNEADDAAMPRQQGKLRVLVEGAVDAEFKNVPASVRLAREGGADEVWLLTASPVSSWPGVDRVFSRLPQNQTAAVYRSCDVVLKLSFVEGMFGPPLEMFHCGGTAIVYDVTGHDEYIIHGQNALVAKSNDEAAVRRFISQLRASPAFLLALKDNARETADAWPDWTESTRQFIIALEQAGDACVFDRETLTQHARRTWLFVDAHWREMQNLRENGGGATQLSTGDRGNQSGNGGGDESTRQAILRYFTLLER